MTMYDYEDFETSVQISIKKVLSGLNVGIDLKIKLQGSLVNHKLKTK
jgi:hypothetical protein